MKLSCALIVRDEEKNLPRVLESIKDVVDEIVIVDTGSTDATKLVAAGYTDKIYDFEWCDDFSKARAFSFEKCSNELVFWIDADDVLVHPEKLKMALLSFENPRVGGIGLIYQYAFDPWGNCITEHWRERVVRKHLWKWAGRLHETMLPLQESTIVRITDCWVKHMKSVEEHDKTNERNLRILQKSLADEGDKPDPRTLFGIAQSLRSFGRFDESNDHYYKYLELSGWPEEKYIAVTAMADNSLKMDKPQEAYDYYFDAIKMDPSMPDAYFGLARVAFKSGDWKKVLYWTEEGFKHPRPDTVTIYNPRNYDLNPLCFLQQAYFNLAMYDHCIKTIDKILEFMPKHPMYTEMRRLCTEYNEQLEIIDSTKKIVKRLKDTGQEERIPLLVDGLPKEVQDLPSLIPYRMRGPEPVKSIHLFCPGTFEFWSPDSIRKGIGGSEEAVINMSQCLRNLGWNVTVFNLCSEDDERDWDGVRWAGYWQARKESKPDVFVYWRDIALVDAGFAGKQTYLWLHDLQRREAWTPSRMEAIDKVMVLSRFHRKDVAYVPEEKIWYTRNGINPAHFEQEVKRDPFRCYYASSPDRGLDILLDCWPEIKAAVPEAELDVYYGFTKVFDGLYAKNQGMLRWKEKVVEKLKQPGVNYHGRIGQLEIAQRIQQSQLLLYPTCFGEISFIGGMKAQAGGAVPVTSNYAALEETIQHGWKIGSSDYPDLLKKERQNEFIERAIWALKNPEEVEQVRKEMQPWALGFFPWEAVASEWSNVFERGPSCVPQLVS